MKDNTKGILLVLSAAILFSFGGLFIKLVPWNALSINAGRCIFSSTVIFIYMKITKHKFVLNKTSLFGAISVWGSMTLYVLANKLTTAANAIVLEYTAPIFIIFIDFFFFHKKPKKLDVVTLIFVFTGIILVFINGLENKNTLGDIIALISGICYALVIMLNRFKSGDAMSSLLMGHLFCIPFGLTSLVTETNFEFSVIIVIVLLGVFQAGLGYSLLTIGTKYTDSLTSSLIASVEPILNPILVAVFYHEYMSATGIIGAAIVIISIALNGIINNKMNMKLNQ